jgi:Bifunctional DNA primase/polymerase, N-terminal
MNDRTDAAHRTRIAPLVSGLPGLTWAETRGAAVDLALHGWPVVPGTYQLAEHRAWLGKPGAAGLEPVSDLWQLATTTNPDMVMELWTRRPYLVLLACGAGVDGVSGAHGQRALAQLSPAQRGPVTVTPFGLWLFFVRSGDEPLRPELAANAHAQLHASGAWLTSKKTAMACRIAGACPRTPSAVRCPPRPRCNERWSRRSAVMPAAHDQAPSE